MTHAQALEAIRSADDPLGKAVEVLEEGFEHYSWVGIYLVEGDDLVLGPWQGPEATDHTRIPVGQGVCGAAAASGITEIVDDVWRVTFGPVVRTPARASAAAARSTG